MKTDTHTKTSADYLKEPYARILIPEEDGRFSAEILEFPGCFSQGDTADEAIRNLEEAARNWVETTLENGRSIPEPTAHHSYSGKIALRLPSGLHQKAAQMAQRNDVSLNTFLVSAIAASVGAEGLFEHIAQKLLTTKADGNIREYFIPASLLSDLIRVTGGAVTKSAGNKRSDTLTFIWKNEKE